MTKTNILIIGAGIAGLTAAELLASAGKKVTVISKGRLKESNTFYAQGGIAAVMAKEDSFESHIADTLKVGAGHNDPAAVRFIVERGPEAIRHLQSLGLEFDPTPFLEAGHSHPRVWRTSDFTGQDILNKLVQVAKKQKENIEIIEEADAVELITQEKDSQEKTCIGVWIRKGESEKLEPIFASHVILATGGIGQLYSKTTNAIGAAGDGLALAANEGLELKDLEFIQFHPTAFDHSEGGRYFLLSEALRGFGAKILNARGETFLEKYDPRAELAPRDVLTRAIFVEQMNGPVYLSMRHLDEKEVKKTFPNITKELKSYKLDLANDPIPITPVAHYSMGGIATDLKGATALKNFYAIGEVACTGMHGANRLASNSLLEALVMAESVAENLKTAGQAPSIPEGELAAFQPTPIVVEPMPQVMAYAKRLGQIMWEKVGIMRAPSSLKEAQAEIIAIPARDYRIQHRQLVCFKIIEACQKRQESLGAHAIASEII